MCRRLNGDFTRLLTPLISAAARRDVKRRSDVVADQNTGNIVSVLPKFEKAADFRSILKETRKTSPPYKSPTTIQIIYVNR
jgi:hypothetical protein